MQHQENQHHATMNPHTYLVGPQRVLPRTRDTQRNEESALADRQVSSVLLTYLWDPKPTLPTIFSRRQAAGSWTTTQQDRDFSGVSRRIEGTFAC